MKSAKSKPVKFKKHQKNGLTKPFINSMEPQNGIEPSSSEWQSDVLTVVLLRHVY